MLSAHVANGWNAVPNAAGHESSGRCSDSTDKFLYMRQPSALPLQFLAPNRRMACVWLQEQICVLFLAIGGGSATGSGGNRASKWKYRGSCAQNGKWITSSAAIVAPQTCDCWLGARFGVLAPARPVNLLSLFLLLFASAFTPVVFFLVFPHLLHIFLSPNTDSDSSEQLNGRDRELFLSDPAAESVPANTDKFRYFDSRVGRHFYSRIGLYDLSSTKLRANS